MSMTLLTVIIASLVTGVIVGLVAVVLSKEI